MIYTCTLNPSIDYLIQLEEFQLGSLNRSKETQLFPGGKGINVSRVMKRLGTESTALGFAGGFTGDYIQNFLHSELITADFIEVQDNTRINVKLKTGMETEINASGPAITIEQQEQLITKIRQLKKGDLLVLAGSIPSSLPLTFYRNLTEICKSAGVETVIDTTGPALEETFQFEPLLIKPNHHELGDLFRAKVSTVNEAAYFGKKLIGLGVRNVIVSMAGEGAVFINEDQVLRASVPKGILKNSVGAGDSVVAGFLASYTKQSDYEEAFRAGTAAGSATAFSHDLCTKEEAEKLLEQVKIEKIG
ncbi:1-phosphofructokinase [Metabacillus sp. KIGAM252]|uniref:Tagatose-6-phosphate kinase n=1 Tax=Metabacillus flavus TaxID=2823519 RepID=A0ABS5LHE3_9BACI|nr:1-phosphofructokinase [Metabacillus flavus]MBS2970041.1 1-phosphofructokinase [Metabacillus flavus]